MAFLIGGANSAAADDAYTVANSCRFDGSSSYMTRAASGSITSDTTWTVSFWVKRTKLGARDTIFMHENAANHTRKFDLNFASDDTFKIETYDESYEYSVISKMIFRDISAWYNIVVRVDTTQGTEADRFRIYVNGSQIDLTEASGGYPTQNWTLDLGTKIIAIGRYQAASPSGYASSYVSEVVYCDGQSLAATSFGEFDEDSPTVWKPIDVSGLTFGNNGFYLDFEASDNLGNDANGGTDFTESGLAATDSSTDTPTNNFAVANPLQAHADTTFAEGNTWTRQLSSATAKMYAVSTIGVANGKWYMEFKNVTNDNDSLYGITTNPNSDHVNNYYPGEQAHSFGFYGSDGNKYTGGSGSSYGSAASSNDIIGVALDITNENLYFSINGTWQNSGDPTSGATGTGAIDISGIGAGEGFYFFAAGSDDTSNYDNPYYNFGNPAFSLTSAANDGNGYGNFEYAPPSGFFSLCTKNLAEYG